MFLYVCVTAAVEDNSQTEEPKVKNPYEPETTESNHAYEVVTAPRTIRFYDEMYTPMDAKRFGRRLPNYENSSRSRGQYLTDDPIVYMTCGSDIRLDEPVYSNTDNDYDDNCGSYSFA